MRHEHSLFRVEDDTRWTPRYNHNAIPSATKEETGVPRMFRVMQKDEDGKPTVGQGSGHLGVRPNDIDTDDQGNAVSNDKGMSVSPAWRVINIFFVPKRLGTGGRGSNNRHCFRRGTAAFQQGQCGQGLELLPDSPTHGVVRPVQLVPLADFLRDLANTREEWEIDES